MDFITLSIISGIGLILSISVIGNFIIWQRISYLSDSIAHSSILGIVLGVVFNTSADLLIVLICFVLSFIFVFLNTRYKVSKDSLLIINSQFSLSLGAIILALFAPFKPLNNYFFGNILAIEYIDIIYIYIFSILILLYIFMNWNKILLLTVNQEVAQAEGISIFFHNLVFVFLVSCVVATGVKFAGVLLIPALMIIPGILALNLAKCPLSSMVLSFIFGSIALVIGILLSTKIDIPAGPIITIILIAMLVIKIISITLYKKK